MAFIQHRQVTVGQLLSGTFEELKGIKKEIGIYLASFFVAGLIVDFLEVLRSPMGLATTIGYFVGQYWLYREALTKAGITYDPSLKGFSFFFMAILLFLPLYFGFLLFVIPGILLAAKWIMAPTYLVAEEINLFEAIGGSWNASSNNLASIALAFTLIILIWIATFFVLGPLSFAMDAIGLGASPGQTNAAGWLGMHLLPIFLLGLSVTAYRQLNDSETSITAVFE